MATHTHTHMPLRLILGVVLFDVRRLNPRRRSSEPPAVCTRWYHIAPVPNRRPRSGLINGRHYWVGADKHISMAFCPNQSVWDVCSEDENDWRSLHLNCEREQAFVPPNPWKPLSHPTKGRRSLICGDYTCSNAPTSFPQRHEIPNRTAVCRQECKCEWI